MPKTILQRMRPRDERERLMMALLFAVFLAIFGLLGGIASVVSHPIVVVAFVLFFLLGAFWRR